MSELRRLEVGEQVQGTAKCETCGADVEIDTGTHSIAALANWARKVLDGRAPAYCDTCSEASEALAAEVDAAHEREVRRQRWVAAAGIPKSYQIPTLAHVDKKSSAVVQAAQDWVDGRSRGLVLLGDVGRGKTFIAGAAAMARTWLGPVRWLSTPALLAGLRAGYGTDEQRQAAQALTPVRNLALVLDDLDKARPTDASLETLFLAIDRWCAQRYPLLITTNWDLDRVAQEWPGSFGPAIASRLAGYCQIVHVKGPDRRIEG